MKKGVGSGVGSGSISDRYGAGDPDPHQNVTDPQHCFVEKFAKNVPTDFLSKRSDPDLIQLLRIRPCQNVPNPDPRETAVEEYL
jgi:hypothetical protein